jgi:AcrR family transcriptional regulator
MGKLIDRQRQAAARQAKDERMERMRREAIRLFATLPFVEVTLDAIGQSAGAKRGVASMYFGSKEQLFLLLLREELERYYGAITAGLAAHRKQLSDAVIARLLAGGLAGRLLLCRLLALAPIVLEQNAEIMEADRFLRWQRGRMAELGQAIEGRGCGLAPGDGLRLLLRLQLTAAAMHPLADPRGSLAVNIHDPDFADFRVDLPAELERLALSVLGAARRERRSAAPATER